MTDEEAIDAALTAVEARPGDYCLVRRNGRVFMALPAGRVAALRTLRLYQPQRWKARIATAGLRMTALAGIGRICLPHFRHHGGTVRLEPGLQPCSAGTAGVMLGSPEHRVRRAILSYRTTAGWEVAKLAYGAEGRVVIAGEAAALGSLPQGLPGAPEMLGVHHGEQFSLMRLPYVRGRPLPPGEASAAIGLLQDWVSDAPVMPATGFPEWPVIEAALRGSAAGRAVLGRLATLELRPVVRHGDFARWNILRQSNGDLLVLDWEWSAARGMPGIDLVHFFAQDARLVRGLAPREAIGWVGGFLGRGDCRRYWDATGWEDHFRDAMVASIAYTCGSGQQANGAILEALLKES